MKFVHFGGLGNVLGLDTAGVFLSLPIGLCIGLTRVLEFQACFLLSGLVVFKVVGIFYLGLSGIVLSTNGVCRVARL